MSLRPRRFAYSDEAHSTNSIGEFGKSTKENAENAKIRDRRVESRALPQVFIEPIECASPREFGGRFVVTWGCVVMEAVLFTLVHVLLKDLFVCL